MRWRALVLVLLAWNALGQELPRNAFLGLAGREVTDELRQLLSLPAGTGVRIDSVIAGGSMEGSGIAPNDVLVQIDDHVITGPADFQAFARTLHAGRDATFRFRHEGAEVAKKVRLKPRPFESVAGIDTLYRAVTVDGSLRRTIVTRPKGQGRFPAVLYVTGVGCFSQDTLKGDMPDVQLLYGLTRAGFVTMRVEKSGVGDSQGKPCSSPDVDLPAEVRGYAAGLASLGKLPFVDAKNVFVLGLSIGGLEAPLLAQAGGVRGVVVVNTVAKPFLEYLLDTRRRQSLLGKTPPDELETFLRLTELCNHRLLIEKQSPDRVIGDKAECRDVIQYPAPFTFMQTWAAIDPAAEWKKVAAPVLVVYGASDYVSTIADDPYLVDTINAFHPGNGTMKAIPDMDHHLTLAVTMEESMARAGVGGEFVPEVTAEIAAWLKAQHSK